MRIVNGKKTRQMDAAEVAAWAARYPEITIDLGAGDGRFARSLAASQPKRGAIALDLCEASLRAASRKAPSNALFVVGDASALPGELRGAATRVTVNFPWGSLLRGLVHGHPGLLAGLASLANGQTTLDVVLNGGALAEVGWPLAPGGERVAATLRQIGATVAEPHLIGPPELRRWPTTWAKRLVFGRDPRAIRIEATLISADDIADTAESQALTGSTVLAPQAVPEGWRIAATARSPTRTAVADPPSRAARR